MTVVASAANSIHCLLMPIQGATLLLPNTTVAEITSPVGFQAGERRAKWFAGRMPWRGQRVPIAWLETLMQGGEPPALSSRHKVAIIRALGDNAQLPFFGLMLQSMPRPFRFSPQTVPPGEEVMRPAPMILQQFKIQDTLTSIPDLEALEAELRHQISA